MAESDAENKTEEVGAEEQTPEQELPQEEMAPAAAETPPSETPEAEPSQEEEDPEQEPAPAEEEGAEEAPPPMSRRKAKRLEKLESLVERLKGEEPASKPGAEGINYEEMIEADPAVIDQLKAKSQEFGQNQFNAGLEEAKSIRFHTRLEIDAPRIEAKYPIFDKESSDFNPAVVDSINRWYLATVGYDPKTDRVANANLRYADFIEGIMELSDNVASRKTTESARNIAKQAASTGLRPDGSSAKPFNLAKAPQEMTDEELSAAIKATMPRDDKGRFASRK